MLVGKDSRGGVFEILCAARVEGRGRRIDEHSPVGFSKLGGEMGGGGEGKLTYRYRCSPACSLDDDNIVDVPIAGTDPRDNGSSTTADNKSCLKPQIERVS